MDISHFLLMAIVWGIPVILAITFHEAAHGFVARWNGDDTAYRLGRVTLNPIRHIDLFGTIILPAFLILTKMPFVFGYAKPVPVDFLRLNNPKKDMVFVALAGPLTNIILAYISALLFHTLPLFPEVIAENFANLLRNSVLINVVLAIFNMIPIPPLDGARVALGLLPIRFSKFFIKLEPYGIWIIVGLIAFPALLESLTGVYIPILWHILRWPMAAIITTLEALSGLG
ncbi:MAG: site-2 protease family protein [Alphaproteobacteria bacterium]|nr:site-2 protease family protein [Alphaproteobacteria bacterium]